MSLAEKITNGIARGLSDTEVRKTAIQFCKDNSYNLSSPAWRAVAINDLEAVADRDGYEPELVAAVETAIATLTDEEIKGNE